jgi:2-methylcitrate dehydratase PrpD
MSNRGDGDNPYTRGVAAFVAGLAYERVPAEVIARIKLLILDSFGCALFGAELPWSRILRATLVSLDRTPACAVWGTGERLSAPHAALVNGALVQSFELDDVHRAGVLHAGAVTLPALMAVAELRPGMTGRDFLRAAVAGYETGPRVGLCMGPEHIGQGWHAGATVGVFAAAAAAAAALRLSEDQALHALGMAGTQAAGLMAAQYGAMAKRMHAGRAAQSGLYGALLAEAGLTGICNVFESRYGGFCTTFSRSQDRFRLAELTAGLGERFETLGVALKFYCCVGSNHTTLDAIRNIAARRPFCAQDIARITVYGSKATVDHVGWPYRPQGLTAAQMNLAFCVATLVTEGDVFVDQFSEAAVTDQRRMALANKVEVVHDPAITARGARFRHMARVDVHLTCGAVESETVVAPRGSEDAFASEVDVVEKFRNLAYRAVPEAQAERIVDLTLGCERLDDVGELVSALAQQGKKEQGWLTGHG